AEFAVRLEASSRRHARELQMEAHGRKARLGTQVRANAGGQAKIGEQRERGEMDFSIRTRAPRPGHQRQARALARDAVESDVEEVAREMQPRRAVQRDAAQDAAADR